MSNRDISDPVLQTGQELLTCTHCGLPAIPEFSVSAHAFCCAGCQTAYNLLNDENLLGFYQLRDEFGGVTKPVSRGRDTFFEFDQESFWQQFSDCLPGGFVRSRLLAPDIHCAACIWVIEKIVIRLEGVRQVTGSLNTASLEIVWNPEKVSLSKIVTVLAQLGYPIHAAVDDNLQKLRHHRDRSLWLRVGVSGALAGNLMLLSVPLYTGNWYGIAPHFESLFQWVSAFLAGLVVIYGAAPFHRAAWGSLKSKMVHIDLPISIGVLIAYTGSVIELARGGSEIFFDSVGGLVFFLLIGRLVLRHGQRKSEDAVNSLLAIGDPVSLKVEPGGQTTEILTDQIRVDDVVRILPGQAVPVDGVVVKGRSLIDNSIVTGESRPVSVGLGDLLEGGATNLSTAIDVLATQVGSERRVAKIATLLQEASSNRAPVILLANKIAGWFTVATLIAAASAGFAWWLIDPAKSIAAVVAVAVVMCPCALGLATPLALAVAQGRASRRGIMVKNSEVIQRASEITKLVFDKTGTLTRQTPEVAGYLGHATFDGRPIWDIVSAIAQHSLHPVSKALQTVGNPSGIKLLDIEEHPGNGLTALYAGHQFRVGSSTWLSDSIHGHWRNRFEQGHGGQQSASALWIECDGKIAGLAWLASDLLPDAREVLANLRKKGIELAILSGDMAHVVAQIAKSVGIDECWGQQTPESKVAYIQQQNKCHRTAMIGDGLNDAASLAAAHLGIAVSGAAEIAMQSADVYLMKPGTRQIWELLELSDSAMKTIKRNLALSLMYNTVGLVLAAAGVIGPLFAAILMPISSLTVVLSSLRQGRGEK